MLEIHQNGKFVHAVRNWRRRMGGIRTDFGMFREGSWVVDPTFKLFDVVYGLTEGDVCNRRGCKGIMYRIETVDECTCHVSPPCCYCTDADYECDECGHLEEHYE